LALSDPAAATNKDCVGDAGISFDMLKRTKLVLCSMALAISTIPAAADAQTSTFWQCVTFARMYSGIQLFGNAATWWNQALGKYERGNAPKAGAVLVFKAIGSMRAGHVATVSQVISDRIVKVTHANWSTPGRVESDVEVMDTSAKNDWSSVRVWFKNLHDLGQREYPAYGFIYGGKAPKGAALTTASADDAKPHETVLGAAKAAIDAKLIRADAAIKSARATAPLAALIG
jgi:surface antigen